MAAEKSNTRLIKLFKEDGKSYFETSSNWISSETDTFIRVDLTFVDVDKYRGFTATIDQDMLQKMKKEARVEDIDDWAKLAFSTSSQDFRYTESRTVRHLNGPFSDGFFFRLSVGI
jgi:N-methylhydantoinase B/oxoprolinase/acetone carboxylase alpha subunit